MGKLLPFILLIGPLIFIHELGHLIAAKLVDVKVLRFSIGFGPVLARLRFGETEYCLAPIPLGGYVRMLGQDPFEELPQQENERALCNKPLWARYFVLAAGPLANLLLPLCVYFFFFLGHTVQPPAIVGTVLDDSAAAAAQLEPGDRVVSIDGDDIRSWKEMQKRVANAPDRELLLEIEREGKRFERYVIPRRSVVPNMLGVAEPRGLLGIYARFYAPQIGIDDPSSPAYLAGLRTGDIITSVNGEPVRTIEELERVLELSTDSQIRLTYLRAKSNKSSLATFLWYEARHAQLLPRKESSFSTGIRPANTFIRRVLPGSPAEQAGLRAGDRILKVDGRTITRWETIDGIRARKRETPMRWEVQSLDEEVREVELVQKTQTRRDAYKQELEYLWLGAEPYATTHAPPLEAIRGRFTYAARSAFDETIDMLGMMWTALRQMVTLERGLDDLGSVIGIVSYADTAAQQGSTEFLMLMAIISLNLGFFNLLPIPILDGGHLLFFTLEALRRRPLGQRAREIASTVGLVVLLLLFLIATRNDIARYWIDP